MKRLVTMLFMVMWVGACNESTTDPKSSIRSGGGGDGFTPPDSVVKREGATALVYGPDHPVTIEREAELTARDDAAEDLLRLESSGYTYAPGQSFSYDVQLRDGRVAKMTVLQLDGEENEFSHLILVRIGDREFERTVRIGDQFDGGFTIDTPVKSESRPQAVWESGILRCLGRAYVEFIACVMNCPPTNWPPCVTSCFMMVVWNFADCLMFSST